jgi:hypothetical protein
VSFPAASLHRGQFPSRARPGRRLAISSLLMVPALFVSYLVAYFVGAAVMSALDLSEGDLLTEAGAWGVIAAVPLLLLVVAPQIVGIVLGVKARRLGERRLGTTGVIVNAAIGTFLLLTSAAQLALG